MGKRVKVYCARDILKFPKGTEVKLYIWKWHEIVKIFRLMSHKYLKSSDLFNHCMYERPILGENLHIKDLWGNKTYIGAELNEDSGGRSSFSFQFFEVISNKRGKN